MTKSSVKDCNLQVEESSPEEEDMAERIDVEGEDMERLPQDEEDNDSDDEIDRLFELMPEDEEDDEDAVEDELVLDTETSDFELDFPAERSGHIAVIDRNIMYVWGGYKVRRSLHVDGTVTTIYHLS